MTLTRGMGEPMYRLLLSLVVSWWAICEACSAHPVPKVLSMDTQGCTVATCGTACWGGWVVRSTLLPGRSCRQQAIGGAGGSG